MISRGSTILRCPLGTAGNALKTTLSESLGALDTLVPWQILAACCWNCCFMSCHVRCHVFMILYASCCGWPDDHFFGHPHAKRFQVTDCNKLFTGLGASAGLVCFRSVVPNVKVMLRCLRKVYVFAMKKSPRIFQQTTGYWWGNEYLLDICTQTSNACVDVDMGRHVGLWLCVKLSTAPQVSWIWCEAVAVATVHWSRWVVPLSEPKDPKTKTLHHASPHWVTECVGPIGSNWCVVHCAATALRPGSHCHHRWHQRHQAKNISDVFRFHTFHTFHTFHVFNSFQLVSTRFNSFQLVSTFAFETRWFKMV